MYRGMTNFCFAVIHKAANGIIIYTAEETILTKIIAEFFQGYK